MKYLAELALLPFALKWAWDNLLQACWLFASRDFMPVWHGKYCGRVYLKGGYPIAFAWFVLNAVELWAMIYVARVLAAAP